MALLVLGGPTAAGKTAAAYAVQDRTDARLISADAMQVYRGLDIGTGKPSAEEQAAHPHACLDVREPHEDYNAADFAADADAVIAQGGPVVVVGGTGLYLRALLSGLVPTPPTDPALRAELEALPDLYAALQEIDPALAARLHPNDRVRILRGLEVHRVTGQRLSDLHDTHLGEVRHQAVRLWLDRDDLHARIDARVLQMVEQGLVAELRAALKARVPQDCKPLKSLGYKHFLFHVRGTMSLDEAIRCTQRDTRRFARKQRAMLRKLGGFRQVQADDLETIQAAADEAFGH
jgi:tRNA dimethylallyltransferase